MIRLACKVPREIAIAVSGGVDSMAALDFLRRNHKVLVLHYDHGTEFGALGRKVVEDYCAQHNLELIVERLESCPVAGESLENFWRGARYDFFDRKSRGLPVITCHHLQDAIETWIFTSFHGKGRLIPLQRDCYVRPFLVTSKDALIQWAKRKEVPFVDDPSNDNERFMRNFIRHTVVPQALKVNPGLEKMIFKKIVKEKSRNCY